jgi:hypothetical protein
MLRYVFYLHHDLVILSHKYYPQDSDRVLYSDIYIGVNTSGRKNPPLRLAKVVEFAKVKPQNQFKYCPKCAFSPSFHSKVSTAHRCCSWSNEYSG